MRRLPDQVRNASGTRLRRDISLVSGLSISSSSPSTHSGNCLQGVVHHFLREMHHAVEPGLEIVPLSHRPMDDRPEVESLQS
jgi:hypothetical protein